MIVLAPTLDNIHTGYGSISLPAPALESMAPRSVWTPIAPSPLLCGLAAGLVLGIAGQALLSTRSSASANGEENTPPPRPAPAPPPIPGYRYIPEAEIPSLLQRMTPEQKVGQMLMVRFAGRQGGNLTALHRRIPFGGVLFFKQNLATAAQCRTLTNRLQALAIGGTGIGLFLASDLEGGKVWRFPAAWLDGYKAPSAQKMAEDGIPGVEDAAVRTAEACLAGGLNMNLAPVLDVYTENTSSVLGKGRCFSTDPEVVAELGSTYIQRLQGRGVVATAKHFPGHGPATKDTHKGPVLISMPFEEWRTRHLLPFARAIRAGGVEAMMTAHVTYQFPDYPGALDRSRPATLSPYFATEVLRRQLGYEGVVITDSLDMGAIAGMPWKQSVREAALAGVDILMLPQDAGRGTSAFQILLALHARQPEVINAAVSRILRIKARHGLLLVRVKPSRPAPPSAR